MTWQPRTLEAFLSHAAETRGNSEALVTPASRLTFQELFSKAKETAGGLQALGLGHGDHVGILMGNDENWLSLFYGAALIGAVTVPVNTRFKKAELEFCLKQADCKALFYVERFMKQDFGAMVGEINPPRAFDVSSKGLPSGKLEKQTVSAQDTLLIQFTSGTTA